MTSVKVPVLIDDQEVPRPHRGLLRKIEHRRWSRPGIRWVQRHHPHLPPIVAVVVRQKLRAR
jgi:hypothetical protein